jgi:outer membrane protein assembly factor BamA
VTRAGFALTAALLYLAASGAAAAQDASTLPTVAEVRVHGNYRTPDDEVVRLAGVAVGQPLEAGGTDAIARRLEKSGRFVRVEVRTRYRSLDEHGPVVIVILVQEEPGSVMELPTGPPNPLRRLGGSLMFAPILDYVDGYGLTYGARTSFVHILGKEGRLSVPLTWGDRKQAALEADKTFATGAVSRIAAAGSIMSRENPGFDIDDLRKEVNGAVTFPLKRHAVALTATGGWADVEFGDVRDRFATTGVSVSVDTRANPAFPRNAVFAGAGWRVFDPDSGPRVNRYRLEAQGYLGLFGSSVLAVRALSETADGALPPYEKALAGGAATLRGFRAGSFVGDNLAAGTVELRLPFHSPMRLGQSGFTIFADAASAYDHGTALGDATWHCGWGAGWYLRAPLIAIGIDVAYGIDRGTRAHVTAGLKF